MFGDGYISKNVAVERANETIQETVGSMLSNVDLNLGFWAEAVATAIHLINRSPGRVLNKKQVAEMVWSSKSNHHTNISRVFGCEAYSHIPREIGSKFKPKSRKCIFLGYGKSSDMG